LATWWSGGPNDVQTEKPGLWFLMTSGMRACLAVTDPPLNPLGMLGTCASLASIPIYGPAIAVGLYTYADYYCAAYAANPPATETGTPVVYSLPADFDPIPAQVNDIWAYVKVQNSRMYQLVNEWTAFKAQWEWFYTHAEFDGDGTPLPAATNVDVGRILAGIYYTNWLWFNNPPPVSVPDVLQAIEDNHDTTDGLIAAANLDIDGLATNVQNAFDAQAELIANSTGAASTIAALIGALNNLSEAAVQAIANAAVGTLTGEVGEAAQLVLDAIALLPTEGGGGAGAPVWPGIAGVTLGTTVALVDGLHLTTAMDGVIIAITTPPSRTGTMNIGDATFDYREGQVAFESDEGDLEMWQYLGFRNALYTPRSLQHAAGARFRVLAGAEGTVTPWTVTP
jgi:hypothetical protein